MPASEIRDHLATFANFKRLNQDALDRLAALCRLEEHSAEESVFRAGQPARAFFALIEGGVRLHRLTPDGREQVVHSVGPGDTFAEAAVIHFGRYPVDATVSLSPTRLLRIDGLGFVGLLEAEPHIATAMFANLCQRLFTLVQRVDELSLPSAGARLAHHLLRLPSAGEPPAVDIPKTKRELAATLAMTPETLSRLLARWRDEGWVEVQGRRIVLTDVAALESEAAGGPPPAPA